MLFKTILIGLLGFTGSAYASSSNVASLTDVKEAVHFLLKDYNSQEERFKELEKRLSAAESSLSIVGNKVERVNATATTQKKQSSQVKDVVYTNSKDDKIILDYLEKRKN